MAKFMSLIVTGTYLVAAYFFASPEVLFRVIYFLIIGIACIWFGDPLGSLTGFRWLANINISQETPGSVIKLIGWIVLLIVPPIILVFQK
jgi:hypothetical protein